MLSGTDSCRIDRHSLHTPALCKSSCNCNELQSGLFGMLLIFNANIWGEQTFRTTEKWQIKFPPLPMWFYPHQLFTAKPVSFLLFKVLYPSVSTIPCSFVFLFFLVTPSVSFFLSAAQSPTVTDPLQQAYAGVQHYAGDLSLLSSFLSHFLHLSLFPLPSPFLFVTSVDTLTGRDSQTSQFPHGLGYFALGLQKDFQLTRLYTFPQK